MGKTRHCRRCGREFTGFACTRCHPRRQRSGGSGQYRGRPEDVLWRGLGERVDGVDEVDRDENGQKAGVISCNDHIG